MPAFLDEQVAFLADIIENRNDPAPRLVYADVVSR